MKANKLITGLAVLSLVSLASCDKDGDLVYTGGADKAELTTSADIIELSKDHLDGLALSFYWNDNGTISLNRPDILPPADAVTNTVEFSATEDFAVKYEEPVPAGVYECRYTVMALNNITGRIGLEPDTEGDMYIRVRSSVGDNVNPNYSNTLKVVVVPFFIDRTRGYYLDKDQNETGVELRSPASDGVFYGFVAVGAWENWYFRDPLNAVWGNLGEDGKVFHASSENKWNFWFPAPSGSYYVTVNTNECWWSALHIDNLAVGGDVSGEMTFNKSANTWVLPVSVPAATTVNITISGQGSLYNTDSGDSAPADVRAIAFSGAADGLTFGSNASAVTIELPTGESSIVLDLNDVLAPTVKAGDAGPVEETPTRLYFSGLVNWDGFNSIVLTDADALIYGGAHYINSEWGYRAYTEESWDAAYKAGEGSTAESGTLVAADSDGNIPAPAAGFYAMTFNMKELTYSLTAVTSVTCTGLGDDWSEKEMTPSADNPEIYTYEYTKTAETPWGVKVLFNHDWNLFMGAGDEEGVAYLRTDSSASGFAGDTDIPVGSTVVLTVDFGNQTFSYTIK